MKKCKYSRKILSLDQPNGFAVPSELDGAPKSLKSLNVARGKTKYGGRTLPVAVIAAMMVTTTSFTPFDTTIFSGVLIVVYPYSSRFHICLFGVGPNYK